MSHLALPHIEFALTLSEAGTSCSCQPRQASAGHQPVPLEGVGVGGSQWGPAWAVAASEPSRLGALLGARAPGSSAPPTSGLLITCQQGELAETRLSPLCRCQGKHTTICLQTSSLSLFPFKTRSSCLESGKCHKGFHFPWLASRECALIKDSLVLNVPEFGE